MSDSTLNIERAKHSIEEHESIIDLIKNKGSFQDLELVVRSTNSIISKPFMRRNIR